MKKNFTLLFLLSALIFPTLLISQDLIFIRNGEILTNGSTIVERELDVLGDKILGSVKVKNQGDQTIEAKFTVTIQEEIIGYSETFLGFCGWGVNSCMPVTFGLPASRTTFLMQNEEVDPKIEIFEINPENTSVKAQYKVSYNGQETVLNVTFAAGASSSVKDNKVKTNFKIITIGNSVSLFYNIEKTYSTKLEIYNLTGVQVFSYPVILNSGSIDLNGLTKGMYICALKQNGKIINSQKFIIH